MPQVIPQSVLVVGASRGIGAATARAYLADGHMVAGTHRGSGVDQGIHGIEADVRDDASIAGAIKSVVELYGRLDVLVVVAGVAEQELLVRLDGDKIRDLFEINTIGPMLAVKHAARAMNRQRRGSIVLVSSESSRTGIPGSSHYTASKAALEGFMRSVMWEYGARGIRINIVAPGATQTDMLAPLEANQRQRLIDSTPLGRIGDPAEIADVIKWASLSTYLNGACIPVTGGEGLGY